MSPDGKLVAYTGIDASRNTWTDSKLYVMNIDGSNPRLVSGDWDRSPQNVQWKADGTGIYFNAQDSGSQNLYVLPMAGVRSDVVQPITKGTYMLTTTSVSKTGKAVGVLTVDADPARHRHLRRREAGAGEAAHGGQRRHPQGQEARRRSRRCGTPRRTA